MRRGSQKFAHTRPLRCLLRDRRQCLRSDYSVLATSIRVHMSYRLSALHGHTENRSRPRRSRCKDLWRTYDSRELICFGSWWASTMIRALLAAPMTYLTCTPASSNAQIVLVNSLRGAFMQVRHSLRCRSFTAEDGGALMTQFCSRREYRSLSNTAQRRTNRKCVLCIKFYRSCGSH